MTASASAAGAEALMGPDGASPEVRKRMRQECFARVRRPTWPYGPEDELREALLEGRATKGFLLGSESAPKLVAEQKSGLLVPAERSPEPGFSADIADRFVFCLLLNGYRWQSSDEDGVRALRRLAEGGHADAEATLGVAYYYGEFVKSDHNEAVRWFRRSAERAHPSGQLYLGIAYANGEGVPTDHQEAVRWLRKAAQHGQRRAADLLERYRKELDQQPAPVAEHELERVRRRAEQGDGEAQLTLAMLYEDGRGVTRDIDEALRWYRASAEGGSAKAQTYLGVVYEKGRGVQQDDREAVAWFRRAAEQGDPSAQYSLGVLLIKGRGAERDEAQGWTWIQRAADRGHPGAREVLRRKR